MSDARLDRFSNCGSALFLAAEKGSGELRLQCNTCKDRWCVACQTARAQQIATALEARMRVEPTRFVTLTRRHSHAPLGDQIDSLYEAFNRLRRREFWLAHVAGGAAFLEVKIGEGSGLWHVHLHIIAAGSFIDQRELSAEWLACTSDSSIVDVRKISDAEGRARYVTKYVTKPASPEVYNTPARFDEMICSLRGRRLCFTFGTWRGTKLTPDSEALPAVEPLRSVCNLVRDGAAGDWDAQQLLRRAALKWPHLAPLFGVSPAD